MVSLDPKLDKVAAKLREAYYDLPNSAPWDSIPFWAQDRWRRVARLAMEPAHLRPLNLTRAQKDEVEWLETLHEAAVREGDEELASQLVRDLAQATDSTPNRKMLQAWLEDNAWEDDRWGGKVVAIADLQKFLDDVPAGD